jgi:hypothetical protein
MHHSYGPDATAYYQALGNRVAKIYIELYGGVLLSLGFAGLS